MVFLLVATLGGIGYVPLASLFAMLLGILWMYFLRQKVCFWRWILGAQIIAGVVVIALAPLPSADPVVVVLDEFVAAGILLLASRKWTYLLVGLVTYGILDYTKPLAQFAEQLPGALGIVGDDVTSAILATALLFLYLQKMRKD